MFNVFRPTNYKQVYPNFSPDLLSPSNPKAGVLDLEKARSSQWRHALGKKYSTKQITRYLVNDGKDPERTLTGHLAEAAGASVVQSFRDVNNGHHKKPVPKFNPNPEAVKHFAGPAWGVKLYNAQADVARITELSELTDEKTQAIWLKKGVDHFNKLDDITKARFFKGRGNYFLYCLSGLGMGGRIQDYVAQTKEIQEIKETKRRDLNPEQKAILRHLRALQRLQTASLIFRNHANFLNAANNRAEDLCGRGAQQLNRAINMKADGSFRIPTSRVAVRRVVFGLANAGWAIANMFLGKSTVNIFRISFTVATLGASEALASIIFGGAFDITAEKLANAMAKVKNSNHTPKQLEDETAKIKNVLCRAYHANEEAQIYTQDRTIYDNFRCDPLETEDLSDYQHRAMTQCHTAPGKGQTVLINRDLMNKEAGYRLDQILLLHYGKSSYPSYAAYSDEAYSKTEFFDKSEHLVNGKITEAAKNEIKTKLICEHIANTGNFGGHNLTLLQALECLGASSDKVESVKKFIDKHSKLPDIEEMLTEEKATLQGFINTKMKEVRETHNCEIELAEVDGPGSPSRAVGLKPYDSSIEVDEAWLKDRDQALTILQDICMLTPDHNPDSVAKPKTSIYSVAKPNSEPNSEPKSEPNSEPKSEPKSKLELWHLHDLVKIESKKTAYKVFQRQSILGDVMSSDKKTTKANLNSKIQTLLKSAKDDSEPSKATREALEKLYTSTLTYYQNYKKNNVEGHDKGMGEYIFRLSGVKKFKNQYEVINRDDMVERMRMVSKVLGKALALDPMAKTPNTLVETDPRYFDLSLHLARRACLKIHTFGEVYIASGFQHLSNIADNYVQIIGNTTLKLYGHLTRPHTKGADKENKTVPKNEHSDLMIKFWGMLGTWLAQVNIGKKIYPEIILKRGDADGNGEIAFAPRNTFINAATKLSAFAAQIIFGPIGFIGLYGKPVDDQTKERLSREAQRSVARRSAMHLHHRNKFEQFSKTLTAENLLYTPEKIPSVTNGKRKPNDGKPLPSFYASLDLVGVK